MDFLGRLKNLIKIVKINGPADNSKRYPVQQVTYNGKNADVAMIFPYGLYANCSSEDSLGIMFGIDGNDENRIAMCYTPTNRPTDLEQNEVAIYHPFSGSFIKFRNNGDIDIDSISDTGVGPANLTINCGNAQVNCSASATIDTPTVTMTNNVQIDGNLNVDGSTTLGATVTSNGKDISDTHTHTGSPTAPAGPISPTGTPV